MPISIGDSKLDQKEQTTDHIDSHYRRAVLQEVESMASLWYYYNLGPKNQQNYTFKCGLQNDASRIILITKPFDYNGVANKLF